MRTSPSTGPVTISVIGCGYLGAVHAAAMATLGHLVIGIDTDERRSTMLRRGQAPFYEPGLDDLLVQETARGTLRFSSDVGEAAAATVHFICVGTPQLTGQHGADLSFVEAALESVLSIVKPGDVVVGKSTVPVGTAPRLAARVNEVCPTATLVWNPEFLREGFAVADTLGPDRVVIGTAGDEAGAAAAHRLTEVYGPVVDGVPVLTTDFATAELVKVAANAFLATKISFINAMAEMCEVAGGDVAALADAMGHDNRIGRRFLNAGIGFGGGCLPKDIRAFAHRATELGAEEAVSFLREVDAINLRRRQKVTQVVDELLDGELVGRRIGILGAAFKPNSDDIRDSPALAIAEALHLRGAEVRVTDPRALSSARAASPTLTYVTTVDEAVDNAEVVLLLTEWDEFCSLDPDVVGKQVATRRIVDGRNVLDAARWRDAGWDYHALGRPRAGS